MGILWEPWKAFQTKRFLAWLERQLGWYPKQHTAWARDQDKINCGVGKAARRRVGEVGGTDWY